MYGGVRTELINIHMEKWKLSSLVLLVDASTL